MHFLDFKGIEIGQNKVLFQISTFLYYVELQHFIRLSVDNFAHIQVFQIHFTPWNAFLITSNFYFFFQIYYFYLVLLTFVFLTVLPILRRFYVYLPPEIHCWVYLAMYLYLTCSFYSQILLNNIKCSFSGNMIQ